jgi:hypothetical protein
MRCAYLSTDEVNNALARKWAAACGIKLFPLAPKDGLPPHPTLSPLGGRGKGEGAAGPGIRRRPVRLGLLACRVAPGKCSPT